MSTGLVTTSYIASAILFILALGGLSHPQKARQGNLLGIAGMLLALVASITGAVTAAAMLVTSASSMPAMPMRLPCRALFGWLRPPSARMNKIAEAM